MERKMTYMTVMGELVPLENKLQKRSPGPKVDITNLFLLKKGTLFLLQLLSYFFPVLLTRSPLSNIS